MIDPRKIGQFLMGEWDKTKQPLKERMTMLPLGQYEDGSVGLAWPGLLADPVERSYQAASTPIPAINDDQAWADKSAAIFDMTSLAPLGGVLGAVDNAVGSAGGKLMKGAADQPQGIRAYHGTNADFDAVNTPSMWATTNPDTASKYAIGLHRGGEMSADGSRVLPVEIRGQIYDATGLPNQTGLFEQARLNAQSEGANAIKYAGGNYEAIKPGTVYSATTGDLLYSNPVTGAIPSLAAQTQDQDPALVEYLKAIGLY